MAAKVDKADRQYFKSEIEPCLNDPLIEFVGEVGGEAKNRFLGLARALLLPIDWPEPFGLVMIEAMACGTPVIAFNQGSVPEVLENGVTGFIVNSVEEAVAAAARVDVLDRALIRRRFEARFTAERMARDYLAVYQGLLSTNEASKVA
jgi:glycosyltransferase involved in cell wall biosynthesis